MQAAISGGSEPAARAAAPISAAREALARATDGASESDSDPVLLGALREWRRNLARAAGVPAFVIFHDTTLRALATARPSTRDELLTVPGIGPVKAERYGDPVLAVVQQHAS
jgi:ATP-dependent DNA helicase RecQ